MNKKNQDFRTRRSLLAGMGVAAAGAVAGSASANAQGREFSPARHKEDAWLDELPGTHRTLIDTSYTKGAFEALLYANNILNAHASAYNGKDSDYALVICWRHYATPLAYGDDVWAKYGETFGAIMELTDTTTGKAFTANPANLKDRPDLPNQGSTIDATLARGVRVAICNHATHVFASVMSGMVNVPEEKLYEEFVASAVPNSRFVSAGVMATTRAQEYGYSWLFAG